MAKALFRRTSSHSSLPLLHSSGVKRKLSTSILENAPTEDTFTSFSHSVLSKLRHRKTMSLPQLTPALVSDLIKSYILPLFETSRKGGRMPMNKSYADQTVLDPIPGTVYAELKLSSALSEKIEELQTELAEKSQLLRDCNQAKEAAISKLDQDRIQLLEAETESQLVKFTLGQIAKSSQNADQKVVLLTSQIDVYRKMFEANSSLTHLHKLKNQSLQLEHGNMLLKLENSVIGERLKGLYLTLHSLSTRKGVTDVLSAELHHIAETANQLTDFDVKLKADLVDIHAERDQLVEINSVLVGLRTDDQADRLKFASQTREKLTQLQHELAIVTEEREKFKITITKLEKKNKDLMDENQRLRQKMRNYRLKRKAIEATDQICRVCQKIFNQEENYNWSCRTHIGEFGGEMWWCCGKSGRDAPGCKVSMHMTKDDEDDEEAREEKPSSTFTCSSCKEIGHKTTECPKDPNIRSKQDLGGELKRITDMRERKKFATLGMESHQLMMSLFESKFGDSAFGTGSDLPSESDSDRRDDAGEEREMWENQLLRLRAKTPKIIAFPRKSITVGNPLVKKEI